MRRLLVVFSITLAISEAPAQPYVGSEMGFMFAPALELVGTDNDWGTRCDLIINPLGLETGTECNTAPPPTEWTNESGRTSGIVAGLSPGYRFGRYRAELEYRYLSATYHDYGATQIGDVVTAEKADQELERAVGGAGDVSTHRLFANVAAALGRPGSKLQPFVGAGTGLQRMAVDYFSLWKRNDDPEQITTFEDAAQRAKIAGTTTLGQAVLRDTMVGIQVLAGLEYPAADKLTVGARLSYSTALGMFKSKPHEWNQLRSHDSTVGRGTPVLYTIETRDTSTFVISLHFRYEL